MQTRPELILLQKSMVIVEGVARSLDPTLNMWVAAEPIAKEWIEQNYGVSGRLRDAGEGAGAIGRLISEVPRLITQTERAGQALASMAQTGVRLDDDTIKRIAREERRQDFWSRAALWVIALSAAAFTASSLISN